MTPASDDSRDLAMELIAERQADESLVELDERRGYVTVPTVPAGESGAIVRAMRDEDNRIVAAKWARIEADLETRTDAEIAAAGQALLEELGLA